MFNPTGFTWKESRIQDLYAFLKSKGYDVYFPNTKTGECTSPYVVLKNNGSSKDTNFSSNNDLYTIMCYVPAQNYSQLEVYFMKVFNDMKELRPLFEYNGTIISSFYDESLKAHMLSVDYRNTKKL